MKQVRIISPLKIEAKSSDMDLYEAFLQCKGLAEELGCRITLFYDDIQITFSRSTTYEDFCTRFKRQKLNQNKKQLEHE